MENRTTRNPLSRLAFELPPSAPAEFVELVQQLETTARLSGNRLTIRLRKALSLHDLNRQELLAAQRDISRLKRIGALPSPAEYWQRTALPRAATLVDASVAVVVEEGQIMGEALDHFIAAFTKPPLADWVESSTNRTAIDSTTGQALEYLLDAVPSAQSIDALGSWWQRRLHRVATVRALPELLSSSSNAELIIGRTEMALLDRPPWSHGDRLLSAFELAHGEIRTQTQLVVDDLTTRVATNGRKYLAPRQRVTIELRH